MMRCRLPWVTHEVFPYHPGTAQTWKYPIKLRWQDNDVRLRATENEEWLYNVANQLLTEDLECCRRHRRGKVRA